MIAVLASLRQRYADVPGALAGAAFAVGIRLTLEDPALARRLVNYLESAGHEMPVGGAEDMEIHFRRVAHLIVEVSRAGHPDPD